MNRDYAFRVELEAPYDTTLERVRDALQTEGFGILTSVDMQTTLREKLGTTLRRYSILGACNPPLAERALSQDLDAGLVLPCTIVVYEEGDGAVVSIADPRIVVNLLRNPALRPIAEEARARLERVSALLRRRPEGV
jgi:uncharacterized protein (DUF302 family)